MAHITRGLRHDFLTISVADPERRHLEVRQVVGRPLARLKVGEVMAMSEVMTDPLADQPIKIWTMEECESLKEHSRTAKFVVDSDLGTIILQNLRNNGEFVAQICVGFKGCIDVSVDDAEFVSRLGQHLLSALENANNLDALRQLQSQLVGHNEQLTEMQEGVERAENLLRVNNQRLIEQNESKIAYSRKWRMNSRLRYL